ncbi:hypothetical protein AYI69_g10052 [Smittium culicis]|uniref:Uncharacterized protein n=1 Tax=Smittium culicis TaxID=133412 RepID=A0A1R1X8D4_9FUNG|nr:hypothetical protein AYI69_g10052 [Smittium culicis]
MMSKLFTKNDIKKTDSTSAPELDSCSENHTARTGECDTPQHILDTEVLEQKSQNFYSFSELGFMNFMK